MMREGPARSRYSNTGDVALVHLQFPVGSFIVWLARYSIRVHLLHRTACTAKYLVNRPSWSGLRIQVDYLFQRA